MTDNEKIKMPTPCPQKCKMQQETKWMRRVKNDGQKCTERDEVMQMQRLHKRDDDDAQRIPTMK